MGVQFPPRVRLETDTMKKIVKHKILLILFLVGTFPAHIFAFLNLLGISQFPEISQRENFDKKTVTLINPVLLKPILLIRSFKTTVENPEIKGIDTSTLTITTPGNLYVAMLKSES